MILSAPCQRDASSSRRSRCFIKSILKCRSSFWAMEERNLYWIACFLREFDIFESMHTLCFVNLAFLRSKKAVEVRIWKSREWVLKTIDVFMRFSALALSHFMPELAQQKLAFSCASERGSFYSFFGHIVNGSDEFSNSSSATCVIMDHCYMQ